MMFCQFSQIRELSFIAKTNPGFKAYLQRLEREPFLSFQDKLERQWTAVLGQEAERAVRFVLKPDLSFSEKSILRFWQFQCGKWWGPHYRELDLITWLSPHIPLFIEVKSCTSRSFHKQIEKGMRQAEINLAILRSRYPLVRGVLVMVNRSLLPLPEIGQRRLAKMESVSQFYRIQAGKLIVMNVDAPVIGLNYVDAQLTHTDLQIPGSRQMGINLYAKPLRTKENGKTRKREKRPTTDTTVGDDCPC
ncbi:hypothetical protein HYR99_08275 [Candidatus Poribacteria bacterium]|nr:hypothetical protein [Candidatus Poribacteria bacterium]